MNDVTNYVKALEASRKRRNNTAPTRIPMVPNHPYSLCAPIFSPLIPSNGFHSYGFNSGAFNYTPIAMVPQFPPAFIPPYFVMPSMHPHNPSLLNKEPSANKTGESLSDEDDTESK